MNETIMTPEESIFYEALQKASYKAKDLIDVAGISPKANNQVLDSIGQLQSMVSSFFKHLQKSPNCRESIDNLFESVQKNIYDFFREYGIFIFNDDRRGEYFAQEIHKAFLRKYTSLLKEVE